MEVDISSLVSLNYGGVSTRNLDICTSLGWSPKRVRFDNAEKREDISDHRMTNQSKGQGVQMWHGETKIHRGEGDDKQFQYKSNTESPGDGSRWLAHEG